LFDQRYTTRTSKITTADDGDCVGIQYKISIYIYIYIRYIVCDFTENVVSARKKLYSNPDYTGPMTSETKSVPENGALCLFVISRIDHSKKFDRRLIESYDIKTESK